MLRSVEILIHAVNNGRKSAKFGNHSMEQTDKKIYFYYHGNCVCEVDKITGKVVYDFCGYEGHSSTTSTINSYKIVYGI